MKKFSIIIATYNAEDTLQKCLDSIRTQKNQDVELVLVDGDSVDETLAIIKRNSDIIDHFITEKDNGVYDAWNKGVKVSKGEWILFLGSDDILCPDTIEKYTELIVGLGDSSIDYISGCVNYVDYSGAIFCKLGSQWNWTDFAKSMTVAHVASLHRKSLFNEIGLFNLEYRICADYELLTRKKDKLKTLFLNEVVAHMRMGGISLSEKAIRETCKISNTHISRSYIGKFFFALEKYVYYYCFMFKIKIWRLF